MWCLRLAAFLSLMGTLCAQDAQLEALRETLATVRNQAQKAAIKGTVPATAMAKAKHQLRDWVESRFAQVEDESGITALEPKLNQELQSVGAAGEDPQVSQFGMLGNIRLRLEDGLLTLTTSVGILCQNDDSAYVYRKKDGRWQRIWESEQQDYSVGGYKPQVLFKVNLWKPFTQGRNDGRLYIMTLGNHWGCTSAWHPVYYRVWRVGPTGSKLLIDGDQYAWMRTGTYAIGSIGQRRGLKDSPVDVLIEIAIRSVDIGVHNREAVLHYLIEGDKVRRVAPVALSPRDFMDEWLTHDWQESAAWSTSEALHSWHRKLHADSVGGTFQDNTKRCQTPGLWQVTFAPRDEHKKYEDWKPLYFLVEWRPPFHFSMKEISDKPWPRCNQDDPEADEWRTLFSTQEWRN
ncbi:MAG: hypothetical protein J0H49_14195 [Acidobacteria bacterium]|nr:hypothetical protein [Acidobacteriota bacterium]